MIDCPMLGQLDPIFGSRNALREIGFSRSDIERVASRHFALISDSKCGWGGEEEDLIEFRKRPEKRN
jgi:hypothetical protein